MDGSKLLDRRAFLKRSVVTGAGLALVASMPLSLISGNKSKQLTILHTNDVHSRIEPFPMDGSKYQGMGGFSKRAALIKKIRAEKTNVLLFDSGDIFQGTPYFNMFHGELELQLMSEMKYDAATLGNHEFDLPVDRLAGNIEKNAGFPFIVSNYEVAGTALENLIVKNRIFELDGIRVGVYGLGIELEGLAPKNNLGDVSYMDPVETMCQQEVYLKEDQNCDLLVCLSHLGYDYKSNKISDKQIASLSAYTDVILGGHTHTFLQQPDIVKNSKNGDSYVFQTGFGGVNMGQIEISFNEKSTRKSIHAGLLNVL